MGVMNIMLHSYLSSVQFICNLRFMFRLGSIDWMVNSSRFASDPRIDKPWGYSKGKATTIRALAVRKLAL